MNKKIILIAFLAPLVLWIIALLWIEIADKGAFFPIFIAFPGCYLGSAFLILNLYRVHNNLLPSKERILLASSIFFLLAGPFILYLIINIPYFKGRFSENEIPISFIFYVFLAILFLTLIVVQILYMRKIINEKKYFILINIFLTLNIFLWPLQAIIYGIFNLGSEIF